VAQQTLLGSSLDLQTHQNCVSRCSEKAVEAVFLSNSVVGATPVGGFLGLVYQVRLLVLRAICLFPGVLGMLTRAEGTVLTRLDLRLSLPQLGI
jgi:hypothetical protein